MKEIERAALTIGEEIDRDVVLRLGDVVPFSAHHESTHAFASSMVIGNTYRNAAGHEVAELGTTTATFLVVQGRLLFIYVYGGYSGHGKPAFRAMGSQRS